MTINNKLSLSPIEKLHIVQANRFIERVQPKWSAITQRFFLYCIGRVNNNKEVFELFEISLSELPTILGYSDGVKLRGDEVKTIFKELGDANNIKLVKDQGNGKKLYELQIVFETVKFDESKNMAYIHFSHFMTDQILQLRKKKIPFTDFQYKEVINIQGSYSARLIELLYQYKKIGKRKFTIEELRMWLGVPENSYKVFKDFRKWIIDQALKEINENEKSSIVVEYNTFRVGRSIGIIEFIIKPRKIVTIAEQQLLIVVEESTATLITDEKDLQHPEYGKYLKYGKVE